MPKAKSAPSKPSGSTVPVTPPTTMRRTDTALHPATPLELIVSRALDQELEWYFTYAENALHRADVGILPNYAVVRVLATEPNEEGCRRQGLSLALSVRMCLVRLAGPGASVLRAAYTPRRWPKRIEQNWGPLSGIVVRLWFAEQPWPARWGRGGLEDAAATELSAALAEKGKVPIGRLRQQADRMLKSAVVAYAKARALAETLGPCATPSATPGERGAR
jgi:hypothetical protein